MRMERRDGGGGGGGGRREGGREGGGREGGPREGGLPNKAAKDLMTRACGQAINSIWCMRNLIEPP